MGKWIIMGVAVAALALGVAAGAEDMGATLGRTCAACHPVKPVCRELGAKDAVAWKAIVGRMVANGAKLPVDSVDAAAEYLASARADQAPFCR